MKIFISIFLVVHINQLAADNDSTTNKPLIKIKVIEEPVKANVHYLANLQQSQGNNRRLHSELSASLDDLTSKAKYRAANFSGPSHLNVDELIGKCFEHLHQNYKWIVCPFNNVTQHEQSIRWNPYKGILGIWYEWEIKNDRFDSMIMLNGDDCGGHGSRRATVKLDCKNLTSNDEKVLTNIKSVSETKTCNYEIVLTSTLFCDDLEESWFMDVYPNLEERFKYEWDSAYSEYKDGIISEKTYNLTKRQIYQEAGYMRNKVDDKILRIIETEPTTAQTERVDHELKSSNLNSINNLKNQLENCQKENLRLRNQLEAFNGNSTNSTVQI